MWFFRHLMSCIHPPDWECRPQQRSEPILVKAMQQAAPQFPCIDARDKQVINRFVLLGAEGTIRRILETMPLIDHGYRENSDFGFLVANHGSTFLDNDVPNGCETCPAVEPTGVPY